MGVHRGWVHVIKREKIYGIRRPFAVNEVKGIFLQKSFYCRDKDLGIMTGDSIWVAGEEISQQSKIKIKPGLLPDRIIDDYRPYSNF